MKRLSGKPLGELIAVRRATGSNPETGCGVEIDKRMLRAFADVCLAVEFAHERGIIHRDLKPANVMLGDFGEVYVLDWGIARDDAAKSPAGGGDTTTPGRADDGELPLDTGSTRAGTLLGTPAYMAPEQLAGERAGRAADIYALGCILYEIVACEPMHVAPRSIAAAVDARPSARRPGSPPELDAICERATALDPAQRPASARALGAQVQAYLDGDRDVAARIQLAREHVERARAALSAPDEDGRRRAMQAAGRALALDPTATEAADIVTRLMLVPPVEMPAEVADSMARQDTEAARVQGRLAAASVLGYLAFVPLLWWTGIKDAAFVVALQLLALASAAQIYFMTRGERVPVVGIYTSAVINAVLLGMICRMVGPFVIAPSLAAATLIAFAAHPRFGRIGIIAAILGAGVAVPWLLELAGVLPATYRFHDGVLELHSDIVEFHDAPVQTTFAALLVLILAEVALFSRALALRQRAARQQLELQAWHLKQIVPARDGVSPPHAR
jgi:serine/threonine-protein kinase